MIAHPYIPFVVSVLMAVFIATAMVVGSYLLGPRKPSRFKETTYECGMTPVGTARERFPVQFYLVAMAFIVFDVELVFLYPWVVSFVQGSRAEKFFLLGEMGVFVAILTVAYVYVVALRVLDWSAEARGSELPAPDDDRRVRQRRKPIRFGNETAEPVRLRAPQDEPGPFGASR